MSFCVFDYGVVISKGFYKFKQTIFFNSKLYSIENTQTEVMLAEINRFEMRF